MRLFKRLIQLLERNGKEVLVTAREYRETTELLEQEEISFSLVGKYGGRRLEEKLKASLERTLELAELISNISPDVIIAHSSPEAARVAYGLSIPHLSVNDSPHAEAVARLTVPLSNRLLTPKIIPKEYWTRYGIGSEAVIQYDAIDPVAWLRDLRPDKSILAELGLSEQKPIVVFRTEETYASYLLDHRPRHGSIVVPAIQDLFSSRGEEIQIVVLPRYESQIVSIKESVPKEVKVTEHVIDSPSLLKFSSVFVGGGGTMTTEAALLGVPTISCYPGERTCVESFLIKKKLVRKISDPLRIAAGVSEILDSSASIRKSQEERAYSIISKMEDPVQAIYSNAIDLLEDDTKPSPFKSR